MDNPKIDLRKKSESNVEPIKTKMPFGTLKPGTIISIPEGARSWSEAEVYDPKRKKDIPVDIVNKEQELSIKEEESIVPITDGKKLELPPTVDISELPPEKQAEILAGLAEARTTFQAMANQSKQFIPPEASAVNLRKSQPSLEPKAPTTIPEVKIDNVPSAASTTKVFCEHCGWDQAKKEQEEPTQQDKLNFLQAFLGPTRFYRVYPLLGGKAHVIFRTLTAEESDICYTQTAFDADIGLVVDPTQYFRTVQDYRMCLGLASIDLGSKKTNLPVLADYETDPLPVRTTKLKDISKFVFNEVLQQEHIRRACTATFYRFQRLAERLEAHVDDPNFWEATERQP